MGLALLSKFTALLLPLVIPLIFVLYLFSKRFRNDEHPMLHYMGGTAVTIIIGLLVLNAGYGFKGSGLPLEKTPARVAAVSDTSSEFSLYGINDYDDLSWKSGTFAGLSKSPLGRLPMPFPVLYLHGIDWQYFCKDKQLFTYYLNGETSEKGWSQYYLEAFLLKTPIPLLFAICLAFAGLLRRNASFGERAAWCVPLVFMIQFTAFVRVDLGLRYLLPMTPFLFVVAAGGLSRLASRGVAGAVIVALACAWYATSIAATFGNGLAYFNETAGGPGGGHRYLVESNLDWGQNLIRLKEYVDENPSEPLLVYNYGLVPPSVYGIDAGWVPCEPTSAVIAISVNHLKGIDPYERRSAECFTWLNDLEPVARLGNGLYVFDARQ